MNASSPFLPGPVILTGARGRLASCLAGGLAESGTEVIRVSRTPGEGCISCGDFFASALWTQASALIHCAWSSLPATAELHPQTTWTEDLPLLARILFGIAKAPPGPRPHFLFLSSGGAVYGERQTPAVEDDPLCPVGWYGRGKVAGEQLVRDLCGHFGIDCCVLRPSNLYGFGFTPDKPQGIAGAALHAIRTGHPMRLFGGGSALKDFLHAADFLKAVRACLCRRLAGTYNICAGHSLAVAELLEMIERATGRKVPCQAAPEAAWDVKSSLLSNASFVSATGWQPQISIDSGLAELIGANRAQSAFSEVPCPPPGAPCHGKC